MNLSGFESMSSEGLQAIRDKCMEILAARKVSAIRRGVTVWFLDADGRRRTIRIERVNTKTVSGREIDPVTLQNLGGQTWRVGLSLVNVVGDSTAAKESLPPTHKPSTTADNAW